jgi:acetyl-CoA carboxylase biotin carboxylase subunit
MRVVRSAGQIEQAFHAAVAECTAAFACPHIYLERFVEEPRHVEFQALADRHGGVWTFGERECSLQRRHQKLIEEAPSPAITAEVRAHYGEILRRALLETGYSSLGTLEFLMDEQGDLYFMEMNTRVQVEHPVTEMTTGVDLVIEQIRVAAGHKLEMPDTRPWRFRGHAVECRVNAEDPDSFAPWPGRITEYHPPGGMGIRVDSGVYGGWCVPPHYDSLLAKVVAHGQTREQALRRMSRALDEFIVTGIRTNIALHKDLIGCDEVAQGRMTTRTVERVVAARRERRAQEPIR